MRVITAWAVAAVAAAFVVGVSAQVFHGSITAVALDVVVEDERGLGVTDLTKADFEVVEDSHPAEIISASFVSMPESAPPSFSDAWSNADAGRRRLFTIVVDDLNTRPGEVNRARDVVRQFVDRVPAGDLLSIVFCGQQRGAQAFTTDKARILRALESLSGRRSDPDDDSADREGQQNNLRVLRTLQNATRYVTAVPDRRKSILFVSTGWPSALTAALDGNTALGDAYRTLVSLATTANVAIYPVDYAGLSSESAGMVGPLKVLARDTGGVSTENTNGFARAFAQIVRDSTSYYLIGYASSDEGASSRRRSHRVSVRVRRRGLVVRARATYSVDAPARGREKSVGFPDTPVSGGRLFASVHAGWVAAGRNRARVVGTLEIAGGSIPLARRGDQYAGLLRFRLVASDAFGTVKGADRRDVTFSVAPARRDQMIQLGSRALSAFDVDPGSYRIQAAIVDDLHEQYGVVTGDLDVPDRNKVKSSVIVSSVFVSSRNTMAMPTINEHASVFENRLAGPPTAQRVFDRSDQLDLYAEIYSPVVFDESAHATVRLRDSGGRAVSHHEISIHPDKGIGGVTCGSIRSSIPLGALEPGRYIVGLGVTVGTANTLRELEFSVR